MQVRELRVNLAHKLAQHLVAKRQSTVGTIVSISNWDAYAHSRYKGLKRDLVQCFGLDVARGKDALDFGCGDGALSVVLMENGASSVHGVDLDLDSIGRFAERLKHYSGPKPTYALSTSPTRIDQPDQKYDLIFCFDVLEHVMAYRESIHEWFRVLKPGGRVCIMWQPYWHPYGHHAWAWIPIPWAHAFLNDAEMNEVAARIVDWDAFDAPVWDRNPDGTRKNRFRVAGAGDDFLNKLTVREFERISAEAGFTIARREFQPFTKPKAVREISRAMTKIPFVQDFFIAFAVYELKRPVATP